MKKIQWAVANYEGVYDYTLSDEPSEALKKLERQMGSARDLASLFTNTGFRVVMVESVTTTAIIGPGAYAEPQA